MAISYDGIFNAQMDDDFTPEERDRSDPIRRRRLTFRTAFVILFTAFLVTARTASAACPSITEPSSPRWTWDTLEWVYSGGLSTLGISGAAAAWNADQSFTNVKKGGFQDIVISDNTSLVGLGQILVFNYGNGGNICYLHKSWSCPSICFNTSRILRAEMELNNNNIGGAASDWNLSVNTVVQKVVSHEIGHFFGLKNYSGAANCSDPTIMSVNDQFFCSISSPTTCDSNAVAGVYAGWSTVSYSSCGLCLLSTSCSN